MASDLVVFDLGDHNQFPGQMGATFRYGPFVMDMEFCEPGLLIERCTIGVDVVDH